MFSSNFKEKRNEKELRRWRKKEHKAKKEGSIGDL